MNKININITKAAAVIIALCFAGQGYAKGTNKGSGSLLKSADPVQTHNQRKKMSLSERKAAAVHLKATHTKARAEQTARKVNEYGQNNQGAK